MPTKLEQIQVILGCTKIDDWWGHECQGLLDAEIAESNSRHNSIPHRILSGETALGDGTWPWTARIDGDDVVVDDCRMTCFGGDDDPQDSGATASGINTKHNPTLRACSLPMDGRFFPGLTQREHKALDGSPIPRVPFQTLVKIIAGPATMTLPAIDLGPGKPTGNALDLTIAAARVINPKATARNFEARGSYRILGAAKYVNTRVLT